VLLLFLLVFGAISILLFGSRSQWWSPSLSTCLVQEYTERRNLYLREFPKKALSNCNLPLQSSIKVITITGLIILGIVLDLGGTALYVNIYSASPDSRDRTGGPNHDRLGFRYWKHPGPFVQFSGIAGSKGRFLAWWAVMSQAAFSFIGTEIVAVSYQAAAHSMLKFIRSEFTVDRGRRS
jgi:hypothetical protein